MKKLEDKIDEIVKLYVDGGLGHWKIAEMYGVDSGTIKKRLFEAGIIVDEKPRFGDRKKKDKYPNCSVDGCDRKSSHKLKGVYYCGRHAWQYNMYGSVLNRTKFDKNKIKKYDTHCEMELYDSKHNVVGICKFDLEKYDDVVNYKWHLDKQGYVVRRDIDTKKRIVMHRQLMGLLSDENKNILIDHINMNKSDNRLSNLRVADDSKNEMNKGLRSNNISGVKGVNFDKSRNRWWGEIKREDKGVVRKRFDSFDDAVKFRLQNESVLFKEYSNNYNPQTNTIQLTYLSHDDNLQTYIEVDLQGNILQFKKL